MTALVGIRSSPIPPLGDFYVANIPPGRYRLLSQQVGCYANQAWVEIRPGKVTEVWTRLDKAHVLFNNLSLSSRQTQPNQRMQQTRAR